MNDLIKLRKMFFDLTIISDIAFLNLGKQGGRINSEPGVGSSLGPKVP